MIVVIVVVRVVVILLVAVVVVIVAALAAMTAEITVIIALKEAVGVLRVTHSSTAVVIVPSCVT